HDCEQASRDLLTRGDDGVVLAGVMDKGGLANPGDELVCMSSHRGDDHSHLVLGVVLPFDVPGHVANAVDVGDGRAAELHHYDCHASSRCADQHRAQCRSSGTEASYRSFSLLQQTGPNGPYS